jgi:hypothetical protein
LYSSIKDVASYINVVRDRLQDVFQVEVTQTDNDIDDLFGAAPVANAAAVAHVSAVDVALAAHIQKPENAQSAREAIVDAIESQRQLKKDAQTANFLLKKCAKAQSELMDAVQAGLTVDAVTQGVELQIQQIEGLLNRIRQFLNEQHA